MNHRTHSWKIAWTFFATCMVLLGLQLVYGFIMGFAHMGYDVLHDVIPFNAARATHTNPPKARTKSPRPSIGSHIGVSAASS